MNGYRELRESAAWFDLSARGKIRASGEDRARLLHAMTTNHVQQLQPGEGCYAFFLNAQGRILADVNLYCFADHFLLDLEPETREKIFQHLDKFIIADDVTIEDVSSQLAAIAVEGPKAYELMADLGAPIPENAFSTTAWGDSFVARVSQTGAPGLRVFAPAEQRDDLIARLGVEAGENAIRTVRLEHGKPRYGEDITERYLAQETRQSHALHFSKGCYLGQEIVERVRSRAQIHRVLAALRIDTTETPEPGAKLSADGKNIAEITSAAFSPALGKTVALAYVRVESAQAGAVLHLGDARAVVVE